MTGPKNVTITLRLGHISSGGSVYNEQPCLPLWLYWVYSIFYFWSLSKDLNVFFQITREPRVEICICKCFANFRCNLFSPCYHIYINWRQKVVPNPVSGVKWNFPLHPIDKIRCSVVAAFIQTELWETFDLISCLSSSRLVSLVYRGTG